MPKFVKETIKAPGTVVTKLGKLVGKGGIPGLPGGELLGGLLGGDEAKPEGADSIFRGQGFNAPQSPASVVVMPPAGGTMDKKTMMILGGGALVLGLGAMLLLRRR